MPEKKSGPQPSVTSDVGAASASGTPHGIEENFRILFDENPHPTVLSEIPSGIITHANKRMAAALGLPLEDIIGKTANDLGLLKNLKDLEKLTALITSRGYVDNVEVEKILPDGSFGTDLISMRIVPVDGKPHCLTVIQDITERNRAEDALRKSEERYRRLVETTDTGYVILDYKGIVLDANQEYVRLSGHQNLGEIRGRCVVEWTAGDEKAANADAVEACMKNGFIRNFEVTYVDKAGKRTPVEINATVMDVDSKPGILSLCRDITERKKVEDELKSSRDILSMIFRISPDAAAITRMSDGMIVDINERFVTMSGYRRDEVVGKTTTALKLYDIMGSREAVIAELNRTGYCENFETVFRIKGGGKIIGIMSSQVVLLNGVPHSYNIIRDITERKQVEVSLRESEEKFSKAFKTSPDAININRLSDGMYLEINDGFTATTGYTAEDVIGRSSLPGDLGIWVNKEDRDRLVAGLKEHGEVIGLEAPFRRKNGKSLIGLMSARIIEINGEACILSTTRDITERKHSEEVLYESEQKYRDLANSLPLAIFEMDPSGLLTFANRTALEWFGYSEVELSKGVNVLSLVVEADRKLAAENMREVIVSGGTSSSEYSLARRDGTVFPALVASRPIARNGKVIGIRGTLVNITERKQTEAALKASEAKYRDLANSVPTGIFESDPAGRFTFVNTTAREWFGYSESDVVAGLHVLDVIAPDDRERAGKNLARIGEVAQSGPHEYQAVRKDGSTIQVLIIARPLINDGQLTGLRGIVLDLTEKKKLESVIHNAARLDSLGILAGGIAHDFNNLLSGIFGYIDLARSVSKDAQSLEYLEATLATMSRARALTLQLLTFAKGGAPVQKITPLVPFIQDTVKFALSGSNISCHFALAGKLWSCNIDKNQIGQVIDNIVINAQQAMPNGGTIEIRAENVSLGENEFPLLAGGDYVKVSIKDSGIGIPRDIMPRIFDPFYTTKTKGHGLGLATCYSIITRHGGYIDVASEPGKGSTFHVYLPASAESAPVNAAGKSSHRGSGVMIVVDDEEVIRITIRKMLESLGYSVVCKDSGREAVDFYRGEIKAKRPIAGIILDLTIPGGMGGIEAAAEIRKLDKTIPVIVVSGYADDSVMKNPAEYGFTASLSKPFTIAELSEVLSKNLTS